MGTAFHSKSALISGIQVRPNASRMLDTSFNADRRIDCHAVRLRPRYFCRCNGGCTLEVRRGTAGTRRAIVRSSAQSIANSIARSMVHSIVRSMVHSTARSKRRSTRRNINHGDGFGACWRYLADTAGVRRGYGGDQTDERSLERAMERELDRSTHR